MDWRRIGLATMFLVLALAAHAGRRMFIATLFEDGRPAAGPELPSRLGEFGALPEAPRLRVMLIDGLSRAVAGELPVLGRLCAGGLDLQVDNGFPTVSLPVQHVLWTGLTQQQSGVLYRIPPLGRVPDGSLPARARGSVAAAESHPGIAHSFGFDAVTPELDADESWGRELFPAAAETAVAGMARLAFVHVLRVDEAGHRRGSGSLEYREASVWSDSLLERLVAADAAAHPGSAWLVLADHGHREAGGHGGAEPSIRVVRACLWGPGIKSEGVPPGRALHLVDLSRAVADLLGVRFDPDRGGRPLAAALARPAPEATLPRPSMMRWGLAGGVLSVGLLGLVRFRAGPWSWPWWLVVAYGGVVAVHGLPTLSVPAVYSPLGRDLALAAGPGWLIFGGQVLGGRDRGLGPALVVVPLAVVVALGVLVIGSPPLLPRWSAELSVWMVFLTGACAFGALSVAILGARPPQVPGLGRLDRRAR